MALAGLAARASRVRLRKERGAGDADAGGLGTVLGWALPTRLHAATPTPKAPINCSTNSVVAIGTASSAAHIFNLILQYHI